MDTNKSKQLKIILNTVLKIVIAGGSIGYLIYLIGFEKEDAIQEVKLFFQTQSFSKPKLSILALLMFANWGVEVVKWRMLMFTLRPLSWLMAIKTQLAAIAGSVFTPYRIGGYFGKVALLEHEYREKGIILQLFNGMAMFITNFFFGLLFIGLSGWAMESDFYGIPREILIWAGLAGALIVLVFWVLFVNVHWLIDLFGKAKWTRKWTRYWEVLKLRNFKRNAIQLLALSVLRYFIITYQYVLAFQVFGIDIPQFELFLTSGALFFLFQFLPVFNAFELGATRASLFSILLIGQGVVSEFLPKDVIALTSACFFIWFLNLAIPSFLGSFLLGKMKVLKEK